GNASLFLANAAFSRGVLRCERDDRARHLRSGGFRDKKRYPYKAPHVEGSAGSSRMAELWYYTRAGKQMEPVGLQELSRMASSGELKPDDLVWTSGMPAWRAAGNMGELFPDLPDSVQRKRERADAGARDLGDSTRRRRTAPSGKRGNIGVLLAVIFSGLVLL